MSDLEDFEPSYLGTKEHWDEVYSRELGNFQEDGDEGEIWNLGKREKIVDMGSGNGHLLTELADRGFECLLGIDYSEGAVALGRAYAGSRGCHAIEFRLGDVLDPTACFPTASLVIDKGTFDAISLASPSGSHEDRRLAIARLSASVKKTLRKILSTEGASLFMITSCNWTKSELLSLFSPEFSFYDEVEHPSFAFGGKRGQTVTTIVFRHSGLAPV